MPCEMQSFLSREVLEDDVEGILAGLYRACQVLAGRIFELVA